MALALAAQIIPLMKHRVAKANMPMFSGSTAMLRRRLKHL